jgi:hypothetical protein
MRLLVLVAAAISSMRAPAKPLSANSVVATFKISAIVRSGSLVRLVVRMRLDEDSDFVIC